MPARTVSKDKNLRYYWANGDNNVECDRTGFKRKASECKREWNGFFVWKEVWEARQPQDLLRGFPDNQAPDVSRPGTGEIFLGTNEVTREDL